MSLIKLLLEFNKISREISNKKDDEDLARFLYEKLRKLVGDENHEKQKYRLAEQLLDILVVNDNFIEFLTIPGYKYL